MRVKRDQKRLAAITQQERIETDHYILFVGTRSAYFEHKEHGDKIRGKGIFWNSGELKEYFSPTGHDLPAEIVAALRSIGRIVRTYRYHVQS